MMLFINWWIVGFFALYGCGMYLMDLFVDLAYMFNEDIVRGFKPWVMKFVRCFVILLWAPMVVVFAVRKKNEKR